MQKPTIYLAADHAGYDLKTSMREHLESRDFVVHDLGAHELDPTDDYPKYAEAVANAVLDHPGSIGVASCGNAEGVCIVANKFDGVRAGIGYSIDSARTMREDDDANVICIPGRLEVPDDPLQILDEFLQTDFSDAPRHVRRLEQVAEIEARQTKNIEVIPAVLAKDHEEFLTKLKNTELQKLAPLWQIDILDGSMFDRESSANASRLSELNHLPEIELHLMVENPLPKISVWKELCPTLKRVIIHAEIDQNVETLLKAIKSIDLEAGLAINPETKIEDIIKYKDLIDTLLIMGVHPGQSGQEFLGSPIFNKICTARRALPGVTIAVDGGINLENAKELALSGVDRFCVGSALWKSNNIAETFQNLKNVLLS